MSFKKIFISFILLSTTVFAASSEKDVALTNIFVQISKKMIPSVVNVFTTTTLRGMYGGGGFGGAPDDLWRRFFEEFFGQPFGGPGIPGGPGGGMPAPKAVSLGSGFVIEATSSGGLILTNNHVIDSADEIKIKFTEEVEEKETDAEVVGSDPDLDIALLKVKTHRKLSAVTLGDSDQLEVGEWVAAVGNPFGHGHSVSHGIVSAKERSLPGGFGKYLQVDAPINPGNSGGPLVNLNAEVVGINNAIDARGAGIGFAIPISQVKKVLPQLKVAGRVERGYAGINIAELQPDLSKSLHLDENLKAPIIINVVPGQPADKAGLRTYDVIIAVDEKPVHSASELQTAIMAVPVGGKAHLKVLRAGKTLAFDVQVAKRPDFRNNRDHFRHHQGKPKKQGAMRPKLGMIIEPITPEVARDLGLPVQTKGIVISQVTPGGPAFQAGLAPGDIILEVDQKSVKTEEDFDRIVRTQKDYLIRIQRQDESGQSLYAVVTLKLSAAEPQQEE